MRERKAINASERMVQKKAQDLESEDRGDIPAHPLSSWVLSWIPLLVHPPLCPRDWPLWTTFPGLPCCLSSGCAQPKGIPGMILGRRTGFLPLLAGSSSSSSPVPDTCSPTTHYIPFSLGSRNSGSSPCPCGPSFSLLLMPGSLNLPCLPLILSIPLERVPSWKPPETILFPVEAQLIQ